MLRVNWSEHAKLLKKKKIKSLINRSKKKQNKVMLINLYHPHQKLKNQTIQRKIMKQKDTQELELKSIRLERELYC